MKIKKLGDPGVWIYLIYFLVTTKVTGVTYKEAVRHDSGISQSKVSYTLCFYEKLSSYVYVQTALRLGEKTGVEQIPESRRNQSLEANGVSLNCWWCQFIFQRPGLPFEDGTDCPEGKECDDDTDCCQQQSCKIPKGAEKGKCQGRQVGEKCRDPEDCGNNQVCDLDPDTGKGKCKSCKTVTPTGVEADCKTHWECCPGYVCGGGHCRKCVTERQNCHSGAPCCSPNYFNCQLKRGASLQTCERCSPLARFCKTTTDCCNENQRCSGKGSARACMPCPGYPDIREICESHYDCCIGKKCKGSLCVNCKRFRESCKTDAECCPDAPFFGSRYFPPSRKSARMICFEGKCRTCLRKADAYSATCTATSQCCAPLICRTIHYIGGKKGDICAEKEETCGKQGDSCFSEKCCDRCVCKVTGFTKRSWCDCH